MQDALRQSGVAQVRVGINSGEVVVRAIGSDVNIDYTAVGETTHVAARLEQRADPGTILLSLATLRYVEGFVDVRPLGPQVVKGRAAPVEVYELKAARPARTRLQASAGQGLSPFVGRAEELADVQRAREAAREGRGQVVALVGEAGVGKSRFVPRGIRSFAARVLLRLGTVQAAAGQPEAARRSLTRAAESFRALGMTTLARRADDLLAGVARAS